MDITPNQDMVTPKHERHMFEGMHLRFPRFKHEHPPVIDVNKVADERLTMGQRVADIVATNMGSWRFIIIQSTILAIWIVINTIQLFFKPFDPYPYILLNLTLSFQAAFAAPFIMISQNRQAEKDRLTAQNDYLTDCKGEEEIRHIMEHLDHQDDLILQVVTRLEEQHQEMMQHLSKLDPAMAKRLAVDVQQIVAEHEQEQKNSEY